ncbi:MAG TPA: L-aspartate oxidase [Vicinamibacterales bacterium]|nr:L-aspartate oxidase [Vicinamibacterales bacterium]
MRGGTDFLIIGSGIAGLRAAADLAAHGTVTVLTKADPTESNTGYAQGGIAAAVGPEDSPEEHFADTMAAGDGLCDEQAVRVLVEDGVVYVRELLEWGAAFDRDATGAPALGREGAHRVRRVLHARDATGREIGRLLWSRVSENPRVRVIKHARATSLMVEHGQCVGASYTDRASTTTINATAVLLATGGAGQVFSDTTNPPIATGDGIALAWRAGARVADLEFVQFHPTALAVAGAPRFLLSEALRGEGAYLVNAEGERFMSRYERAGELASRDLVSRAIVSEAARTASSVFLSMQHLDPNWVHERFPTIAAACLSAGLDLARDLIPVGPAAHYVMGGVETDRCGRTTLPGLCAAGEVACTGVHGANRLASNSLLEGLVFGARAVEAMVEPPRAGAMNNARLEKGPAHFYGTRKKGHALFETQDLPTESAIRGLMWQSVGLLRDHAGLAPAVDRLQAWQRALEPRSVAAPADDALARASSIATVGWLIAKAALRREESRGGHFRTDFPGRDDLNWQVHVAESR